ncbi:MAG: glycosyl transferase [Firmicutes bacterium]|nr:glycosyl transferase [Bacillota bacterium]
MNVSKAIHILGKCVRSAQSRRHYIFDLQYRLGLLHHMPDEAYLQKIYRVQTGKTLHLHPPKTFNEKLQWLKLYDRNPDYTKMADKIEVKRYIAQTLGEDYVIPTLGVWDDPDDIDFADLPDRFVLKCSHDSGSVIICKDKAALDTASVRTMLKEYLTRDFYHYTKEWPYKNIPRKVFAEQYMVDESGTELKDYKILCFNGEPKLIELDFNRFSGHKRNIYDLQWNLVPMVIEYPTDDKLKLPKPPKLDEMLAFARTLSRNIPHVRVDFYSINGNVYFGELTFFHGSGYYRFIPEAWDGILGEWITLPESVQAEP